MKKRTLIALLLLCATLLASCDKGDTPTGGSGNGNTKTEQIQNDGKPSGGDSSGTNPGASEEAVREFVDLIQGSEYAKAIEHYKSNILGNYQLETDAYNQILALCSEINQKTLSGEYNESTVKTKLGVIEKVVDGVDAKTSEYTSAVEKINDSLASKAAYTAGCDLEALKNYADAIGQFKLVIEGDSNYGAAVEAIGRCRNSIKQDAFAKAEALAAAGDYIGAIAELKKAAEILPDDSEVLAKVTVYEKTYISTTISQAEAAFVKPATDWEKALSIINTALQYYPENSDLLDKVLYYQQFEPKYLYDMTPYTGSFGKDASREDNFGNVYERCFSISNDRSVVYAIEKQYNSLSFTISPAGSGGSTKIMVYGDGRLLYESPSVVDSTRPISISVDITGVSDLKIEAKHVLYSYYTIVADATLQRTVK